MKDLMWAGGVKRKAAGDDSGVVTSIGVGVGSSSRPGSSNKAPSKSGGRVEGTGVNSEQMEPKGKRRDRPGGRIRFGLGDD